METIKIIIELKGGIVQSVYSSSKEVEVDILDYDDMATTTIKDEVARLERLEKEAKELKTIY